VESQLIQVMNRRMPNKQFESDLQYETTKIQGFHFTSNCDIAVDEESSHGRLFSFG
jgi:hypothetical protein